MSSGPGGSGVSGSGSGARDPVAALSPLTYQQEGARLVTELGDGRKAVLSLEQGLQRHISQLLVRYEVPQAAVVAMEPSTGRVLAYVSHYGTARVGTDLARDPTPPSASIFKVVTAAALIDSGVSPSTRVCYGGGFRRLRLVDLDDNPRRDRSCTTFEEAMGGSVNAVFAKLADRHLSPQKLTRYASAFGFGHALPFDLPTKPSRLDVPAERIEFARTAAGFWHMHMSPLHGALIAATIANRGVMPRASVVDRVVDGSGNTVKESQPRPFRSVIPRRTAEVVVGMMRRTVSHGTSRSAFYDPQGRPFLPGIAVAGKTGSLTSHDPYRAYNWWVGFAPARRPTLAVSALVVNGPRWRIKGSYVAREALRHYLKRVN